MKVFTILRDFWNWKKYPQNVFLIIFPLLILAFGLLVWKAVSDAQVGDLSYLGILFITFPYWILASVGFFKIWSTLRLRSALKPKVL